MSETAQITVGMTERVLIDMLTENTGRALCDSGGEPDGKGGFRGGYGRNWERNQGRTFLYEPAASLEFWPDPNLTVNVFHFLRERLEYDEALDREFHSFADERPGHWLELIEEWFDHLREQGAVLTGFYGEGDPIIHNTYNSGGETISQTLQFAAVTIERPNEYREEFVLLQIHGGCDVRGGYTAPRAFRPNGAYGGLECMFDECRGTIYCEHDSEHMWYTDDGYSWYGNNDLPDIRGFRQEMEILELDEPPDPETVIVNLDLFTGELSTAPDQEYKHKGKLVVDAERNGYCPICGHKLIGAP